MASSGLIASGSDTRGRVVLPNSGPYNNLGDFKLSIRVRDLRVSHPTKQIVMAAPALEIAVQGGNLVFTTTLGSGATCSVALGGETDGEIYLERSGRENSTPAANFTLRFTARTGSVVGSANCSVNNIAGINISGGNGLSIAANNSANTENLQAKIDDFQLGHVGGIVNSEALRYGFANNGNDSSVLAQHLTMANDTYEATPEVLGVLVQGSALYLSGITPEPGYGVRIYRRAQYNSYDYAHPFRPIGQEPIYFLPIKIDDAGPERFFYVARIVNLQTGVEGADSNEVAPYAALAAPPSGRTRITFDDVWAGAAPASYSFARQIAGDRYKAQGVLISAAAHGPFVTAYSRSHTPFGSLFASSQPLVAGVQHTAGADGVLTFDFVLPGTNTPGRTGSVSFYVDQVESPQSAQWKAEAFDNGGTLLQTIQGTTGQQVTFTRPAKDIRRVVFTATTQAASGGQGCFETIDTLEFENPIAL